MPPRMTRAEFAEQYPLEQMLHEIEHALAGRFYYLAIVVTVTLPDVCAALESEDGKACPNRFRAWYDEHLAAALRPLTAEDCYSFRCGVLPPDVLRGGPIRMDDVHAYNVVEFCDVFIGAVRRWFEENREHANLRANLPRLVQFRPDGMTPYIRGLPVIG